MAKILFLKFPKELKEEMIGLTGRRIPSLSSILELTGEAIKRLQVKVGTSTNSSFDTGWNSSQGVARGPKSTSSFHIGAGPQTLPGYSRSLPPILFVTFIRRKKSVTVNCLLDTRSGRSYLSAEMLRGLGSIETIGMNCQVRLSTLLGKCDQTFKEVALEIDLGCGNPVTSHVLVAESIDLSVRLTNLEIWDWLGLYINQGYYRFGPPASIRPLSACSLSERLGLFHTSRCCSIWSRGILFLRGSNSPRGGTPLV